MPVKGVVPRPGRHRRVLFHVNVLIKKNEKNKYGGWWRRLAALTEAQCSGAKEGRWSRHRLSAYACEARQRMREKKQKIPHGLRGFSKKETAAQCPGR